MPELQTKADALELKVYETNPVALPLLAAVGTLPGTVITGGAHRNGPGRGYLRSSADGTQMSWKAPGSASFGAWVDVSTLGERLLEDGEDHNKWIRLETVSTAYLVAAAQQQEVYLRLPDTSPLLPDVSDGESGEVNDYVCWLKNVGRATLSNLVVWIDPGTDYLEVSDDGLSFVAPTTEATGLNLGSLGANEFTSVTVRRTIPAATTADPKVIAELHFRFDGV